MLGLDWVTALGIILFLAWAMAAVYRNLLDEDNKDGHKYIIVIVKNQEKIIEDIVRRVLILQRKFAIYHLIIVDLNSQDQTREIITKMAYPDDYFSLLIIDSPEELKEFLTNYENDSLIFDYTTLYIKNPGGQ